MGEAERDTRALTRDRIVMRRTRDLPGTTPRTDKVDPSAIIGQGVVIPLPRQPEDRVVVEPDEPVLEAAEAPTETRTDAPGQVPTLTWRQKTGTGRVLARLLLGAALGGVGAGLVLTATVQTPDALAILVGATIVAVLTWSVLTNTAPTTVTLAGSVLHVRRGRNDDYFDLAGEDIRMRVIGRPNRPTWQIRLENLEGSTAELGAHQVDAPTVHAAVLRYCDGRRGL